MDSNIKHVVSMLANDKAEKTTLFTATGEIIELKHDGPYHVEEIVSYLTPLLTGTEAIELNLTDYTTPPTPFSLEELASAGIQMTQIIDGKSVQGIFYPEVAAVTVTVGEEQVVIPHVENLQAHMSRAASDGSPSVINFFKRLAPVIQARKHSGEDLMMFIKKSEMPLTNSGRIIAYKRVKSHPTEKDYFVDSHSGKIKQRVGSRVTMPVDMVDPSRHNSCSTGLHVANLGYLGGFSGDKTIIVLVDPENFIAVPHGEDTKARVSSYDIVGVMSANSHDVVNQGKHVEEDMSFSDLIVSAVEGTTITPFEEVMVGNKTIERVDLITVEPEISEPSKKPTTGKSLESDPKTIEPKKEKAKDVSKIIRGSKYVVTPPEVIKAFDMMIDNKPKAEIARELETSTRSIGRWIDRYDFENYKNSKSQIKPDMTIAEKARVMFDANQIDDLKALKKSKKKSWSSLGFSEKEISKIS